MELKDRMAKAISESGVKKSELAARLGISPSAITQWVNGSTTSIDGENLVKAAEVLKVNPTWLATGRGSKAPYGMLFQGNHQSQVEIDDVKSTIDIQTEAIKLLTSMDQDDAHLWLETIRAASNKARRASQQKERDRERTTLDPPQERRRTSN